MSIVSLSATITRMTIDPVCYYCTNEVANESTEGIVTLEGSFGSMALRFKDTRNFHLGQTLIVDVRENQEEVHDECK